MELERGDAQYTRAKEDGNLAGYDPWFHRKRCTTGDGDPQNMECMVCGAAFGEACRSK